MFTGTHIRQYGEDYWTGAGGILETSRTSRRAVFGFGNRKKVLRMGITSFLTLMVILLADYWKVALILAILAAIPGLLKKKQ